MSVRDIFIRLFVVLLVATIFFIFHHFSTNKDQLNKAVFLVHIIILFFFFTNRINIPDIYFVIIWWSMGAIGLICCIDLSKKKSKIIYLLAPTTIFFIFLSLPMIIISNM